jgi:hypothetical protein
MFVAGSAVFSADDPDAAIGRLRAQPKGRRLTAALRRPGTPFWTKGRNGSERPLV